MMHELIDTLHTELCSLVVLHEGNVTTFDGVGVRRLYNIAANEPELLHGAKVAVKTLGRTAARMLMEGGVSEVWADVVSEQAYDVLNDAGVVINFERRVGHAEFLKIWQRLNEE